MPKSPSFLNIAFALQISFLGTVGLDLIGLEIPLLRQIIGFIYLTSLPGCLVLGLLGIRRLDSTETVLFSTGLSIGILMMIGLLANIALPIIHITNPLSAMPFITVISLLLAILSIASIRFGSYNHPMQVNIEAIASPTALFLMLLPILAIFGTYVMNLYKTNIILIVLIIIIILLFISTIIFDLIPENTYPLAIFAFSISLLFHTSLITNYLIGYDIQYEYFIANYALKNSFWDNNLPYNSNGMLSVAMLAPIYSLICDIELVWVFKIIFIIFFSLVPLGIYKLLESQTGAKIAFLSCFFFISFFVFYGEMIQLSKQQLAELFLILIVLLITDKTLNSLCKSIMAVIFAFSLVVSHYGLSYIFLFSLILAYFITFFLSNHKLSRPIYQKFSWLYPYRGLVFSEKSKISGNFILFFLVIALSWYTYASPINNTFYLILTHIINSALDLLNPVKVEGIGIIIAQQSSLIKEIIKYLNLLLLLFILVGILDMAKRRNGLRFSEEYIALSYAYFGLCILGISFPFVASSLNTSRFLQISLMILSTLGITGALLMLNASFALLGIPGRSEWMLGLLAIFFSLYFSFNVGLVSELIGDVAFSIALQDNTTYPHFNDLEVLGAKWMYGAKVNGTAYADEQRFTILTSFEGFNAKIFGDDQCFMGKSINQLEKGSYLYLGKANVIRDKMVVRRERMGGHLFEYVGLKNYLINWSRIYSNGNSEIWY